MKRHDLGGPVFFCDSSGKKKMINMMASSLGYISLFHVFLPMCLSTAEGRLSVFTENKSQVFYLRLRL